MLFVIGLLLLIPFPSFQTTASLKRDSAGGDMSKADAVFPLSKPKPAAAPPKHTVRSNPKPNTANLTVLSAPAINQKPSAVNATLTAKSKLSPAVFQTTPLPAVKATPTTTKDKPTGLVNRTMETKPLSTSDVKNKPASSRVQTLLSTPAKAVKAISAADDKDKLTVSVNQTTATKAQSSSSKTTKTKSHSLADQTVSVKSTPDPDVRDGRDKAAPTRASDVQPTPTKTASVSRVSTTKEKHQPLTNETVSGKSQSVSEVKPSKDTAAPTGAPDVQATPTKSASAGGAKSIKDQVQPSANETVSVKSAGDRKDKAAPTGALDIKSNQTPTKSLSASGAKTVKEKLHSVLNQTVSGKSRSISEVKPSKDKPAPTGAPDVQATPKKSALASVAKSIKDKVQPTNETVSVKSPSASDMKPNKDKPASTVQSKQTLTKSISANTPRATKAKLHSLANQVNQTGSGKSQSVSDMKPSKDKSASTGAPDVQSTTTKSPSRTSQDNVKPLTNDRVSVKSPSAGDVNPSKDGPASTGAPDVQSNQTLIKSFSANGSRVTKVKLHSLVNQVNHTGSGTSQSVSVVKPNKDKPASTGAPDVQSTPVKSASQTTQDKVKPPTSVVKPNKDKPAPTGAPDVQSTPVKSASQTTQDKVKPPTSDVKPSKDKPAPTGAPDVQSTPVKSASQTTQDKVKPPTSDVKPNKDKPASTGAPDVQSTPVKSASQTTQDKVKPPTSDVKPNKDKPASTGAPDVQSTPVKSASQTTQDKVKPPTSDVKPNKDKPASTGAPDVQSNQTSTKSISANDSRDTKEKPPPVVTGGTSPSGSEVKPNTEKPTPTGAPDVHSTSVLTTPAKASVNDSTVVKPSTTTKENLTPLQPVKVVINNGCDSSNAKQQELQLQPGAPLVMTHKISLLPGGCTRECESEMAALTQRVVRLEREMALLKDKCPCSGNCPADCSGNGKCEKGKCVCHEGFEGPDCKVVKRKIKGTTGTTTLQVNQNTEKMPEKTTKVEQTPKNGTEVSSTAKPQTKHERPAKSSPDQRKDRKKEEAGGSKTTEMEATGSKNRFIKQKDEPQSNVTQSNDRKAIQPEKNVTQSHGHKTVKEKVQTRGAGLGSVKAVNVSSNSFTLAWLAPQGMFKNFTVIRTEPQLEGDDHDDREGFRETSRAKNSTEGPVPTEGTKPAVSSDKSDTKRISIVVPGSVRSVEFSNLRSNTRYSLQIYGAAAEKRSKIHRATAVTGPKPATDIVFSNVSESSLTVSWSKPKSTHTGFRVTYTNAATGESRFVTVGSGRSHAVLSKLSAGSTYTVSVTATLGTAQSDALASVMTTVPAPPTHLQVVNVTDSRAVLQWTPSLGKVDRFVVTYESSKTPNVTVTVTLSGGSVEQHLRGLQRGTEYTVRVLSQKGSLQSTAASTTFTTANAVKASEVGPRSAVITWKTPAVGYHSYRVTYRAAGEEKKEVTLEASVTQYKLTGLLPMSHYAVLVQGEREGHYTSLVTTDFITGKLRFPFPTECSQELLNGALQSGEVDIYPQGKDGQAVRVYCDMETDGGGWTVFQRRMNGRMDFYRNWSDYRAGFGNLGEEFWLGNDLLRNLTSVGPVSLRVDMRSGNDTAYAHYANFSIESERRHYALTVSGFTGTAGDSMKYHNGRPFSTWDKDPLSLGIHCAKAYTGGWWYKNCYKANLNGRYGTNSNNQGIVWIDWKGKDFSIPFTEMKFRPSVFSPATHG